MNKIPKVGERLYMSTPEGVLRVEVTAVWTPGDERPIWVSDPARDPMIQLRELETHRRWAARIDCLERWLPVRGEDGRIIDLEQWLAV